MNGSGIGWRASCSSAPRPAEQAIGMTTPSRLQWVYATAVTPVTTRWASTATAGRAVILPLIRWPVM
jgi:hypothetical protein